MHATSMSAGVSPVFSQIFGPAVREYISVGSSHSVQPAPPWEFDDPTSHIGGCLQLRAMSSPVIRIATAPSTSEVQSSTRNGSLIQRAGQIVVHRQRLAPHRMLVGTGVRPLRDGDLAEILTGGAVLVLVAPGPHGEPLRRHHEPGRGVELVVVRHLHRPLDVAEPVARAAVERPVHQHRLAHARLDHRGRRGDLVGHQVAAAVHARSPTPIRRCRAPTPRRWAARSRWPCRCRCRRRRPSSDRRRRWRPGTRPPPSRGWCGRSCGGTVVRPIPTTAQVIGDSPIYLAAGSRGSPRMRSAMRFLTTSDVPPAIVRHRLNR